MWNAEYSTGRYIQAGGLKAIADVSPESLAWPASAAKLKPDCISRFTKQLEGPTDSSSISRLQREWAGTCPWTHNPNEAAGDADRALRATGWRKWPCSHAHTKRAHPPATTGDTSTTAPMWKGTSHILKLYLSAVFSLTKYNLALAFWETAGKNCAIVSSNILFLRLGYKHISPQAAAGNSRFVQILLDLVEMTPHFWQGKGFWHKMKCMNIPLVCNRKLPWFSSFASVTAWWPTTISWLQALPTAGSLWKCLPPMPIGHNFHQSHRAPLHWLQWNQGPYVE